MTAALILVVDDHELNLKLLRLVLERRGYRVNVAASAREAKSDPDLGAVPIIAVTSHAMKGDDQRILAAGCDAYLSKPIDKEALLALIEHNLAQLRGACP